MSWAIVILQAIILAVGMYALSLVPMAIAGVKDAKVLAAAPLFSTAFLGVFSLISLVVPWSPLTLLAEFAATCFIAVLARVIVKRQGQDLASCADVVRSIADIMQAKLPLVAWGCAGVLVAFALMAFAMSGLLLESPIGTQNYDNPFHYSVVRHILDTGSASAIGAGSVMGSATAIYPDLWHAVTALVASAFGIPIPVAGWTTCLMLLGVMVPIGLILMTRALFPSCQPAMLFLAAIGYEVTNYTIIGFIGFGSLFANLYGVAMLPFAIAVSIPVFRQLGKRYLKQQIVVAFVSIIALGLSHPSTVFVYGIVVVPMLFAQASRWISKLLISAGAGALWVLLFNSSFFARTVNCIDRTGTDIESGAKYAQRFGLDYAQLAEGYWILAICALLFIAICGLIAWKLNGKWATSWYLVAIAFLMVLTFMALFTMNQVSVMLTGFWYRDEVRLRAITLYLLLPLLGVLAVVICRAIGRALPKSAEKWVSWGLIIVVVLGFCGLGAKTAMKMHREYSYATGPDATLTAAEVEFMKEVASLTEGEVVLNNFDDNSVWMYPIYDINALIKGRAANQMSAMDEDLCTAIEGISNISTDTAVREAASGISLKWVVRMSDMPCATTRFNELGQIEYQPCDSILNISPDTEGFELIYALDGMQLYRVLDAEH